MVTAGSSGWSSPKDDDLLEAESFQAALDGLPVADPELQELVGLARSLGGSTESDGPNAIADPAFVAQLRNQLVDEAATGAVPADIESRVRSAPSSHRKRTPRLAVAALSAALILTLTTAGVATAAQSAEPGSTLYPVKTGLEGFQVEITQNPGSRGRTEFGFATIRLQEIHSLIKQENPSESTLSSTIAAFSDLARSGSQSLFYAYRKSASRDDIFTIRAFVDNALVSLHRLDSATLPTTAQTQIATSIRGLVEIANQAHTLCNGCTPEASPSGMPMETPVANSTRPVADQ